MFPRFVERRALPEIVLEFERASIAQYWDDTSAVGREFRDRIVPSEEHPGTIAWDVFVLFDAEATWATAKEHVVAWGRPVEARADELFEALLRVTNGPQSDPAGVMAPNGWNGTSANSSTSG